MTHAILSDADHESLYATRKRLMSLPPERIVDLQTKPPAPLKHLLSSLGGDPAAVRAAIVAFLKAINELCDGALRQHGKVNLSAVQAAEDGFAALAERFALGTEDPTSYLRALRDARAKGRNLDVAAIEASLRARAERNFDAADRLQRDLLAQGVVLLDHAQGTDWTLAAATSSDAAEAP